DSEEEELDDAVANDIERFEASFNITRRYRLVNRIRRQFLFATFSTAYKAEDLLYDHRPQVHVPSP
ncbi:hypothetical protein EJ03DRAFT_271015, partial [Teratosphaeria nubilosa]